VRTAVSTLWKYRPHRKSPQPFGQTFITKSNCRRGPSLNSMYERGEAENTKANLRFFRKHATPPHVQVCHCTWFSTTRPSPAVSDVMGGVQSAEQKWSCLDAGRAIETSLWRVWTRRVGYSIQWRGCGNCEWWKRGVNSGEDAVSTCYEVHYDCPSISTLCSQSRRNASTHLRRFLWSPCSPVSLLYKCSFPCGILFLLILRLVAHLSSS